MSIPFGRKKKGQGAERLLEVGVLTHGVDGASRRAIERALPAIRFTFYEVDWHALNGLYHKVALSPMAYARALMADLVPWEKFVYLDIDVIVRGDVSDLYHTELGEAPIAACFMPGLNSGMLVVNAEHWRKHGIGQRVLEYARKHQPKEADQASIEAICGEAALKLDPTWNVLIDPVWGRALLSDPDYYRSAKLLHFITGFKPWNLGAALLPAELRRLWRSYYLDVGISRQLGTEAKVLAWQLKTLAVEAGRQLPQLVSKDAD